MHLRIVVGDEQLQPFEGRPFSLDEQPMRPGVAHEQLVLAGDQELEVATQKAARREGVPISLWATIAIESQRALETTCAQAGVLVSDLTATLDEAASSPLATTMVSRRRRLTAYARALRHGRATKIGSDLRLSVPYHSMVAWEQGAAAAAVPLPVWASRLLAGLPSGRCSWEASAAEHGQTLAEWIALQAARRRLSS